MHSRFWSAIFTRDARRADRVKFSVGYLFFLHAMPAGQTVSRFRSAIFFLFTRDALRADRV